jgi:hypothetical protein
MDKRDNMCHLAKLLDIMALNQPSSFPSYFITMKLFVLILAIVTAVAAAPEPMPTPAPHMVDVFAALQRRHKREIPPST